MENAICLLSVSKKKKKTAAAHRFGRIIWRHVQLALAASLVILRKAKCQKFLQTVNRTLRRTKRHETHSHEMLRLTHTHGGEESGRHKVIPVKSKRRFVRAGRQKIAIVFYNKYIKSDMVDA